MATKQLSELPSLEQILDASLMLMQQTDVASSVTAIMLANYILAKIGANTADPVTNIAVTEAADGTVTMVNTFASGSTETIVITPDEGGNPATLTYNGTAIPITWVEAAT